MSLLFKLFFLFLLLSQIKIRFFIHWGEEAETDRVNCYQRTVSLVRCRCLFPNGCESCLPLAFGNIHSCIPETFIQFGKTETAVYLRPLERVFAFGKGYALYLACLPLVFELGYNTLSANRSCNCCQFLDFPDSFFTAL